MAGDPNIQTKNKGNNLEKRVSDLENICNEIKNTQKKQGKTLNKIYDAISGNKELGTPGYQNRVKELENKTEKLDRSIGRFTILNYISYGILSSFIGFVIYYWKEISELIELLK